MREVGTLREIGARVGDVVELMTPGTFRGLGAVYTIVSSGRETFAQHDDGGIVPILYDEWVFRIVSRAAQPFNTLTAEEKGALMLANHEGKIIEMSLDGGLTWERSYTPLWIGGACYRVRADVTEWVSIRSSYPFAGWVSEEYGNIDDTHRITFQTVNGKPDCNSIRMEEL